MRARPRPRAAAILEGEGDAKLGVGASDGVQPSL